MNSRKKAKPIITENVDLTPSDKGVDDHIINIVEKWLEDYKRKVKDLEKRIQVLERDTQHNQ